MAGYPPVDAISTIDLPDKDQPDELVGKRHRGEREYPGWMCTGRRSSQDRQRGLLMVGYPPVDAIGTVDLLYEDQPDELVGKCHRGEREDQVSTGPDKGREPC